MENNIKETNSLILWTWQIRGFPLTEGKVDHRLSEFDKTHNGYKKSCEQLAERLGTDQFIWCFTHDEDIWKDRVKWELKVPKKYVLLFCSITWHWILNRNAGSSIECVPPEKIFDLCYQIDNHLTRDEFVNKFHDGWRNKTIEELWDVLFVDKVQDACTHALLPYPIQEDWISKYP
jgi:hypothetical protein